MIFSLVSVILLILAQGIWQCANLRRKRNPGLHNGNRKPVLSWLGELFVPQPIIRKPTRQFRHRVSKGIGWVKGAVFVGLGIRLMFQKALL